MFELVKAWKCFSSSNLFLFNCALSLLVNGFTVALPALMGRIDIMVRFLCEPLDFSEKSHHLLCFPIIECM